MGHMWAACGPHGGHFGPLRKSMEISMLSGVGRVGRMESNSLRVRAHADRVGTGIV